MNPNVTVVDSPPTMGEVLDTLRRLLRRRPKRTNRWTIWGVKKKSWNFRGDEERKSNGRKERMRNQMASIREEKGGRNGSVFGWRRKKGFDYFSLIWGNPRRPKPSKTERKSRGKSIDGKSNFKIKETNKIKELYKVVGGFTESEKGRQLKERHKAEEEWEEMEEIEKSTKANQVRKVEEMNSKEKERKIHNMSK